MRVLLVLTLTRKTDKYYGLCGSKTEKIRAYIDGQLVYGKIAQQSCALEVNSSGHCCLTFPGWKVRLEHVFS